MFCPWNQRCRPWLSRSALVDASTTNSPTAPPVKSCAAHATGTAAYSSAIASKAIAEQRAARRELAKRAVWREHGARRRATAHTRRDGPRCRHLVFVHV